MLMVSSNLKEVYVMHIGPKSKIPSALATHKMVASPRRREELMNCFA